MTITLSVHRADIRCTEPKNDVLKDRLEGSDQLSGQQRMSVPVVQNKDERDAFDEVFLPHLPEAYRLAQWLTGSASDAEDVVQEAALRAFRGIKSFGAVNARGVVADHRAQHGLQLADEKPAKDGCFHQ